MSVRIIQKGITAHLNQLAVMAGYPARITGLVIARDTSAVEKWFHGKTIPRNRSAAQNAIIVNYSNKHGRAFFFDDDVLKAKIKNIIEGAVRNATYATTGHSAAQIVKAGVQKAVDARVASWKDNVRRGRTKSGRVKRLKPRYEQIKKALYPDAPILVRTGQLLDSFDTKVE